MERYKKLQRLKTEISRLLSKGLNGVKIFDRLHADPLFSDVTRTQIHHIYKHLQKKNQSEVENERQIAECGHQIEECGRQIAECRQQSTEFKRRIAKAQNEKSELERMIKYQQRTSNYLVHGPTNEYINIRNIWQNRFVVDDTSGVDNMHTIEVHDMFQNKSKTFSVQKLNKLEKIWALKFPFVLLHEYDETHHFRLLELDFESSTLHVLQEFDHGNSVGCYALVDSSNSSKFLLHGDDDDDDDEIFKCELVGNQIQIGKQLTLRRVSLANSNVSYFGNRIYQFQCEVDNADYGKRKLTQAKMLIYDLDQNDSSTIDLDPTPENLNCYDPEVSYSCAWIRDCVFIPFSFTGKYGVIFTNSRTRSWSIVEFVADWRIDAMQSSGQDLVICTKKKIRRYGRWWLSNYEIFKIPMRKPDSLRNMAWLKVVNAFKNAKVADPYAEARRYLPLNSDIQPFVFTEA